MPYGSRNYNTRNSSGRYNTPGQFVPASDEMQQQQQQHQNFSNLYQTAQQQNAQQQISQQQISQQQNSQQQISQQQNSQQQNAQQQSNFAQIKQDVEMKQDLSSLQQNDDTARPPWMKNKLSGVKKISNKERRRRQNETLRRLLSPKNALMVLNEMMPGEQVGNQFKVEAAMPGGPGYFGHAALPAGFQADLTLEGHSYKGFGETKMTARNAAAEQAIRDFIIKRMGRARSAEAGGEGAGPMECFDSPGAGAGAGSGEAEGEGEEEALPMLQLASYALHKLFSEWEFSGHKVPQMRPLTSSTSEAGGGEAAAAAARKPKPSKVKEVPLNAGQLHPCMLLTYMRPALEYRCLDVDSASAPQLVFSVGVDVDGTTYVGKASNKKEARKQAATAACKALFNVEFQDPPSATTPLHA